MQLGRKGWTGGATVIVGALITMFVLIIISSATMWTAGVNPFSPQGMVKYYQDLLKPENLKDPIPMVLSFFIPFIATFAMTWAFIGILPVFKDYTNRNADKAAALLALSTALITTPSSSLFFLNFWPWSMGFMVVMIGVGFIAKGFHIGVGSSAEAGTGVREALGPISFSRGQRNLPRDERTELTERRERENQNITNLSNSWNQALRGYLENLNHAGNIDIRTTAHYSTSREWEHLCRNLEELVHAREAAINRCNTMLQALQNPQEFTNLFRDQFMAAGLLHELQNYIQQINQLHDAARRNLTTVEEVVIPKLLDDRGRIPTHGRTVNESRDLAVGCGNVADYLNRYNDFINWQHSATGDINALRTRTIATLNIT